MLEMYTDSMLLDGLIKHYYFQNSNNTVYM